MIQSHPQEVPRPVFQGPHALPWVQQQSSPSLLPHHGTNPRSTSCTGETPQAASNSQSEGGMSAKNIRRRRLWATGVVRAWRQSNRGKTLAYVRPMIHMGDAIRVVHVLYTHTKLPIRAPQLFWNLSDDPVPVHLRIHTGTRGNPDETHFGCPHARPCSTPRSTPSAFVIS